VKVGIVIGKIGVQLSAGKSGQNPDMYAPPGGA